MHQLIIKDLSQEDKACHLVWDKAIQYASYVVILRHSVYKHYCGYLNVEATDVDDSLLHTLQAQGVNFYSIGSHTLSVPNRIIDLMEVPYRQMWLGMDFLEQAKEVDYDYVLGTMMNLYEVIFTELEVDEHNSLRR